MLAQITPLSEAPYLGHEKHVPVPFLVREAADVRVFDGDNVHAAHPAKARRHRPEYRLFDNVHPLGQRVDKINKEWHEDRDTAPVSS